MNKFLIVFLFFTFFSLVSFFYLGGKNYQVIKGGKAAYWPKEKQILLSNIIKLAFKFLAIATMFLVVIPMAMDIPILLNKDFNVIEGYPSRVSQTSFGMWYLRQSVEIKDVSISLYFNAPIRKDRIYKIYYLPRSKYGVEVKQE
ncbi:MAG: hypothetical protein ACOY31_10780 [Bacillota bacterium]